MPKALISVILSTVLFLSGCGYKKGEPAPTPCVDATKEYISCYLTSADDLNPLLAETENDIAVFSLIYDSLIYLENDMSIVPQLAKSCTVSGDCTSINFVLRDDIYWHDGEKFTSEDVAYTIRFIKNSENETIYRDLLAPVSDIQITDDYNFTLNLTGPYARVVNLLDFPIIPSHDTGISKKPMGTGKYMYQGTDGSSDMVLTKNNLWSLGDLPIEENVIIRLLGKSKDEFSLFKTGDIDVLNINAAQMSEFGFADNSQYISYTTPKYEFIGFNHSNRVFAQPEVRKALSLAINRDEIVKESYLGLGTAANSPILPTAYFYNLDADNIAFSTDKASSALADAGWADVDGDGVLEKSIDEVTYRLEGSLLVNSENPLRMSAAEKISEMLSKAGFKISVAYADWDSYTQKIQDGEFSLFYGGTELMPSFDLSFLLSSWAVENGQNFMNYSSSDMDNVISKTHVAVSMEELKNAYLEFQYIFTRDMPIAGILFQHNCLIYQNDITGVSDSCFSKPLLSFNRWHRGK